MTTHRSNDQSRNSATSHSLKAMVGVCLEGLPHDHPIRFLVESLQFAPALQGAVSVAGEIRPAVFEACLLTYQVKVGHRPINAEYGGIMASMAALYERGEREAAKMLCADFHMDPDRQEISDALAEIQDQKTSFALLRLAREVWPEPA